MSQDRTEAKEAAQRVRRGPLLVGIAVIAFASLWACAPPDPASMGDQLSDDEIVLWLCLADLSSELSDRPTGGRRILFAQSQVPEASWKPDLIEKSPDIGRRRWQRIEPLARDLMSRIESGATLPLSRINDRRIRVVDEGHAVFSSMGYEGALRARTWLPGYSEDGQSALVHLEFDPSGHGASGTYFLIQQEGRWTIAWRCLLYGV